MRKVFLSYSSSDQKVAESIASKLNSYGIDVWRDRDRLYAGQEWREGIEKAIASSVAVVVLVSPRSLRAPYVTFEWAYALGNGARVIPVLIEPTPDTDRHPIATLHYLSLDFTNPSVEELVEEINRPDSDGLGRFLAQDFPPSYRTDLEECEELWLVGVSLRDTIKDLGGVLRRKLAARQTVNALVAEPIGSVVEPAARRTAEKEEGVRLATEAKCREIEESIRRLMALQTEGKNAGRLEIKTTKYPLGYGIHGIDICSSQSNSALYVKLYTYQAEEQHKPKFVLLKGRDRWYESFSRELLALWRDGRPPQTPAQ